MAEVEIKYNNSTIASLNDAGSEILETNGKICDDDIEVKYNKETVQAGIPVATKSAVSDASVYVTPSVTNQSGYINGGTITGDRIKVSASDLIDIPKKADEKTADVLSSPSSTITVSGLFGKPKDFYIRMNDSFQSNYNTNEIRGFYVWRYGDSLQYKMCSIIYKGSLAMDERAILGTPSGTTFSYNESNNSFTITLGGDYKFATSNNHGGTAYYYKLHYTY